MAKKRVYKLGICCDCNNEAQIMAKGLCKRCYSRLWARKTIGGVSWEEHVERKARQKQENSFGVCKSCNKEGKLQSLDQCPRCYKKTVGKVIVCRRCGNKRRHEAHGLCSSCYVNTVTAKRKRLIICAICGEERSHKAKGLCSKCYGKQHKKDWQGKIITCLDCKQEREHMAKGLCVNCYWRSIGGVKYNHQRQARKLRLPATLTAEEWLDILEEYNHSCAYCGIKEADLVQEHWIPLSRGGGYTTDNIVPACKTCNSRKHTMTGDEYLEMLEKEALWIEQSK